MNREAFHARPVQLVSQVCGVLHAPVGDVKFTDPGFTEGDRDGGGGSPGTEEQDALARVLCRPPGRPSPSRLRPY